MGKQRTTAVILLLFCFVISFLTVPVNAKSWIVWSQTYGGKRYEAAEAVVETSDGGFAIAGWVWPPTGMMLVKTDKSGNKEWTRIHGISDHDWPTALVQTSDGGYALAGYANPFEFRGHDFCLVKTDANGNMEWNQLYGGTGVDRPDDIIETSDGGFALVGYTDSLGAGSCDFWLVKTDALGNMEWTRSYGGQYCDKARSLVETSDGGYMVFGVKGFDQFFDGEPCLIKTNSHGRMEWNQTYNVVVDRDLDGAAFVEASDGGFLLAIGDLIMKTDELGNVEWNKTCPVTSLLARASDGGYALAGDDLLVKTDVNGNIEWNQTYGGEKRHSITSLVATSDGGFVLAGWYGNVDELGKADFWVIKTDEYGRIPEFPSWIILPLFLVATLSAVVFKKSVFHKAL
jgi:hypothetical protein